VVDADLLRGDDLISTPAELTAADSAGDLHGIYQEWAQSIVSKMHPQPVISVASMGSKGFLHAVFCPKLLFRFFCADSLSVATGSYD
jgi:hypothetical protein